jgi:hypothetical protein
MNIYWDSEFTGLHRDTTLISLGMVADNGREFYAEFTDYDPWQVDDWVQEHVIDNLLFNDPFDGPPFVRNIGSVTFVKGDINDVRDALESWLSRFDYIELWSDCHHYDVVLLQGIFGGAFSMPSHIYYIPFDLSTALKVYGIDPDISREAFIDSPIEGEKHNSLYDARVIQACYDKLRRNKYKYQLML